MEPVRQPTRHHPKSLHQKVGFINMITYWDWYNKAKKKRITYPRGKVMRYAFIRKQVYYEEAKHESNSAINMKALMMPTFKFP